MGTGPGTEGPLSDRTARVGAAIPDIVSVAPAGGTRVHLVFDDGLSGEVDVALVVPFTGLFAPLADPGYFRRVAVIPHLGTIGWPNGADLDPVVLHDRVTSMHDSGHPSRSGA